MTGVSITSPIAASIVRVYQTPPRSVDDTPSVIIVDAARRVLRGNGKREKRYDVRLRLVVRDADRSRGFEIADAFEEALINTFDGAVRLGLSDNYHVIEGPNWEEKFDQMPDSGKPDYTVDGTLVLALFDAKAFTA
jgi:hypothetical protein